MASVLPMHDPSSSEIGPGRKSGEDAFFPGQPPGGIEYLPHRSHLRYQLGLDELQFQHRIAAALNAMVWVANWPAGENGRTLGFNHVTERARVRLLESRRAAAEGAAATDEITEGVNLIAGLRQNFRTGV